MRITKHLLTFSALALLGACANSGQGFKGDLKDFAHWVNGKPSHMEKKLGKVPTGYTGHNTRGVVLKPQAETVPVQVWNEVGEYGVGAPAPGQEYNQSVTVYPVDGGMQYADSGYPSDGMTPMYDGYGQLVQQMQFAHGSSRLSQSDKASLSSFGKSIVNENNVSLTVIGHASQRVNGVSDPARKKQINFEMAQKRADEVTKTLKNAGVNPGWIESVSRGAEEANPAPGGLGQEAADRRAEVYLHGQTSGAAY